MKPMSRDKIEFEDDAPLELTRDNQLEGVSRDEVGPSEEVNKIFAERKETKDKRDELVKGKKPALKLRTGQDKMKGKYKPKDYIVVECFLCQHEYTSARKDDNGAFEPIALCQHVAFRGVVTR